MPARPESGEVGPGDGLTLGLGDADGEAKGSAWCFAVVHPAAATSPSARTAEIWVRGR